jgi:hypothetical protein
MFAFLYRINVFREQQSAAIKAALTHIWEKSASRHAHGSDDCTSNRKIDRIMRESNVDAKSNKHQQRRDEFKSSQKFVYSKKKVANDWQQSAVFTRLTHGQAAGKSLAIGGSPVSGSSYVSVSRSFRHIYDRTNQLLGFAETQADGARHYRLRLCRRALKKLRWNCRMEVRFASVLLMRQHRFMKIFKENVIAKKRVRLYLTRHFMVMRNKYLLNKYTRLFMEPMLRMLRHGFSRLQEAVASVDRQGAALVVLNQTFWQQRMFNAWQVLHEQLHNERYFWKKRLLRKIKWIVGRRAWVNMEGGPIDRGVKFPLRWTLNTFGYRMTFARRVRLIAEAYCNKRLARKGFASLIVLVSERRQYYDRLVDQLGKGGQSRLCKLTAIAHIKHRNLVSKIVNQARHNDESRMRVALDRMVYREENSLSVSSSSSLNTGGVEILLSQVASFENYLSTKMERSQLAIEFAEDESEYITDFDGAGIRPTRDSQVKSVLKSLRRKSVSVLGTSRAGQPAALHPSFLNVAHEVVLPPDPKIEIKAKRRASVARRQGAFKNLRGMSVEGAVEPMTAREIHEAMRGMAIAADSQRGERSLKKFSEPTTTLTRIMHGAQMLEIARGRKKSWALQLWHNHVQGLSELRQFADDTIRRLRSIRAFRQFRLTLHLGHEQKKLTKLRALYHMMGRQKKLRAQRNFLYTSVDYHEAATALRALRKWHVRARVLSNIRTKAYQHHNHQRYRSLDFAMYKWRVASFATKFAVCVKRSKDEVDEEEDDERNFRRSRLLFKDLE